MHPYSRRSWACVLELCLASLTEAETETFACKTGTSASEEELLRRYPELRSTSETVVTGLGNYFIETVMFAIVIGIGLCAGT